MPRLRRGLHGAGASIGVLAKIESAASVDNLESILDAVDGAMVARGDLGAELPVEEVPPAALIPVSRLCSPGGMARSSGSSMYQFPQAAAHVAEAKHWQALLAACSCDWSADMLIAYSFTSRRHDAQ